MVVTTLTTAWATKVHISCETERLT